MADIHTILPHLNTAPFDHLLPSLDRHGFTISDLLSFDSNAVQKRTQLPTHEIRKLQNAIQNALLVDLGVSSEGQPGESRHELTTGDEKVHERAVSSGRSELGQHQWKFISTLDGGLDEALGGGISPGYIVEITGESATAKTLFILQLLLSVQLAPPLGLAKSAIYISTEAPLPTKRLNQLLATNPMLKDLQRDQKPSLSRILSVSAKDMEAQDHYLRFQVPIAIERHNVGLVVLDSVAANLRADFDAPNKSVSSSASPGPRAAAMAKRSQMLTQLGSMLRKFARQGIVVVVANQVSDRFSNTAIAMTPSSRTFEELTPAGSQSMAPEPSVSHFMKQVSLEAQKPNATRDPMTLDHQQRWFTGWGDDQSDLDGAHKTPSLGLVWANQIAARIALHREPILGTDAESRLQEERIGDGNDTDRKRWRRKARVVFAPWVSPSPPGGGVNFEVLGQGMTSFEP